MNKITEGKIIKSIGGLYHVETANGIISCKAKGIFRLRGISPVVGDWVKLDYPEFVISEIYERKNELVRPPLANIDAVVIVVSVIDPRPNTYVIDKLTAILEMKNMEPILVFTKIDRKATGEILEIYQKAGFKTFFVDNISGLGSDEVSDYLENKTTAFIGNSGVGKSSLLNVLLPNLSIPVGDTSKKLGRGRHTTRHVELYPYKNGYIADTPGFSTVEAARYGVCPLDELAECFRDFPPFLGKCPFKDCSHTNETECEIKKAVSNGDIAESRYSSYVSIYNDIKLSENTF